jgi:hypothetical protein
MAGKKAEKRTTDDMIADAIIQVIRDEGLSSEWLTDKTKRAPLNFWKRVESMIGETRGRGALRTQWQRIDDREVLIERILDALNQDVAQDVKVDTTTETHSVNIDIFSEVVPVIVDTVDKGCQVETETLMESEPQRVVEVDKVDIPKEPEPVIVDNFIEDLRTDILDKVDKRFTDMLRGIGERFTSMEERVEALSTVPQAGTAAEAVNLVMIDMSQDPPLPGKAGPAGKKLLGSKEDLRARVDSELFKLLDADCRSKYGGNLSRALDAVLWKFYQKPKLSFETDET